LAGRRVAADVVLSTGEPRRAEFIPLGVTESGAAAVLVWLPTAETAAALADEDRRYEQESQRLHAVAARVQRDLATRYAPGRLVGVSPAIERVRRQMTLAASNHASTAIVGPAGVGKGHIARTIHALRVAAAGAPQGTALVPLDGPTLDAELLQSTIRGLVRAAGDDRRRAGDLLIHDVDRMPTDAQVELAGFLRLVDPPIRFLVTAREPLDVVAMRGPFPAELAGRLSTLVIDVPPLVQRPEDVPPLAQHFVEEFNATGERQLGGFTTEALDRLAAHAWPGNVAELAEVVAASCAQAEGALVTVGDLPRRLHLAADAARYAPRADETIVLDAYLADIEKELLQRAMVRAKGNKTKAAQLLGLTRPRLYRRLIQLGLEQGPIIFEQAEDETTDEAG
jgi:DNA-binding NtrC family response regulator